MVAIARVTVNRQLSIEINGIASLRVACSVNGAADNIIGSFLLRNTLDTTAIKDFFVRTLYRFPPEFRYTFPFFGIFFE